MPSAHTSHSPSGSSTADLIKLFVDEYWHPRHNECIIDAHCRVQCVLLAVADAVVPEEPEPGSDATLAAYVAWQERMRVRERLLKHVH